MPINFHQDRHAERGRYVHLKGSERLMFITHRTSRYTECDEIKMVLEGGCSWVQLRMKDRMNCSTAIFAAQLCNENSRDITLCINDNIQIALTCGATAVHLGKEDIPISTAWDIVDQELKKDKVFHVGATANTFEDILNSVAQGASYIGLGPYRHTDTKKRLSPVLGLEGYRRIIAQCKDASIQIPIYAIGGICLKDVGPLMETGITGIAVSGAIINAEDPTEETRCFIREINKY